MPSSVTKHTIPCFYACYFLRSLSSPGTTYIGSTPAPPRRKRQHNGDLTQGAYKTARARPWEMECIVYGFSSKIAALQFEWAWAKPHLSRHLKFLTTEYAVDGTANDTSEWAGKELFPSTSLTPGQTRWGKPKKRMARPPSTPNARLLAMRALLGSEPFCGWGLKLAFFTEWSWLAYQRLDMANSAISEAEPSMLRWDRYSRSGKPLHPLYPVAVCDFSGVDGRRIPLVHVSAQHRLDAGVADQPVKKQQISSKKKADDLEENPAWPETLPRSANLKGLDACVQDFDTFPAPRTAPQSTDLTKKAKRSRAASGKIAAVDEDAENEVDDDDAEIDTAGPSAISAQSGSASTRPLHRMRFDDLAVEEAEWTRLQHVIAAKLFPSSTATRAMSDFLQICVQRYIAAQDARTAAAAVAAPTTTCALCNTPIDLSQQLDFALCPNPHAGTLPTVSTASSTGEEAITKQDDNECSSVFHLSCLADSFLQQQSEGKQQASSISTVLPTHGTCPCHTGQQKQPALWADVVRAMYRRHERFERLIQLLVRSGRTLQEHLNPEPEAEATVTSGRAKGKAKTRAAAEAAEHVRAANDIEEVLPNDAKTKNAKAAVARKRGQSIGVNIDAEAGSEPISASQADEAGAKKDAKRKTTRKAKLVKPSDVIDLT